MKDWVAYYNSAHSIYVNARHRDVHYARLADEIAQYVPSPTATVLDYGCGEALHADRVAQKAGLLFLADAASTVRAHLIERFGRNPKITVVSTEHAAAMPAGSFDFAVMHSVSQYLSPAEFDGVVRLFHHLLKPGGLFLVGDVVPPDAMAASDALALLRFGWRDGFFVAAILGLVRTVFSDYRRLRAEIGLTRYSESEIVEKLTSAGFMATRAPVNLGHLQSRMTFLARKSADSAPLEAAAEPR